ncbi:hypothetical protein BDZ97DRAFT_117047 [Flammula alnicola]|nr:hypothetical protein BDZ97DRAFT_117047 [Flammula alnicola]
MAFESLQRRIWCIMPLLLFLNDANTWNTSFSCDWTRTSYVFLILFLNVDAEGPCQPVENLQIQVFLDVGTFRLLHTMCDVIFGLTSVHGTTAIQWGRQLLFASYEKAVELSLGNGRFTISETFLCDFFRLALRTATV